MSIKPLILIKLFTGHKEIDNQEIRIQELQNQANEYKEKLIESQKIIESNNSSKLILFFNLI